MRLLSAPPSPFGRKVKIVAHMKGVMDQITFETADTRDPTNLTLRQSNPLGKIPVLILDDGTTQDGAATAATTLYDSHVICEYFDSLMPSPALFPKAGVERYVALTRAALADGIMEAGVLAVYEERLREPAERSTSWVARQLGKASSGFAALELDAASGSLGWTEHPSYDHVAVACALGYFDLRFAGSWRADFPNLVTWLDTFAAAVPAFETTRPT